MKAIRRGFSLFSFLEIEEDVEIDLVLAFVLPREEERIKFFGNIKHIQNPKLMHY